MDKEKLIKAVQINDSISGLRTLIHAIEQFKTGYSKIYVRQEESRNIVYIPDELKKPIMALIEDHYKSKLQEFEQKFKEL